MAVKGMDPKTTSRAVFHVTERGKGVYFRVDRPLESVYAAACLRSYLLRQPSHQAETFGGYLQGARAMSRNDYEWYTANLLGRGNIVAQVYDVDLDHGAFSILHKNGWRNYPVGVVCDAAHQAGSLTELSSVPEPQCFLDRIARQEIRRDDLEICIRGDRRLDPGEISFSDEVVQMEQFLNFYIDVCFLPDVVLGTYVCTDENDDYVNIYANYDLERGALCDALDVTLWRGDDSFVELKYRLSPEEKEMLLPKIEEYCQRQTGMTLGEWHEQYRQETAAEFRQGAPAQGMEPQM